MRPPALIRTLWQVPRVAGLEGVHCISPFKAKTNTHCIHHTPTCKPISWDAGLLGRSKYSTHCPVLTQKNPLDASQFFKKRIPRALHASITCGHEIAGPRKSLVKTALSGYQHFFAQFHELRNSSLHMHPNVSSAVAHLSTFLATDSFAVQQLNGEMIERHSHKRHTGKDQTTPQ